MMKDCLTSDPLAPSVWSDSISTVRQCVQCSNSMTNCILCLASNICSQC